MVEFLTSDGRGKIEKQLQKFRDKKPQIAERIRLAKELGDLSENAEYVTAKEDMAWAESEIKRLEGLLKTAVTVERSLTSENVVVGSKIKLKIGQEIKSYTLVGSEESDPSQGLISYQSPLGQALMDKKVNDKVLITTPKTSFNAEIISIE